MSLNPRNATFHQKNMPAELTRIASSGNDYIENQSVISDCSTGWETDTSASSTASTFPARPFTAASDENQSKRLARINIPFISSQDPFEQYWVERSEFIQHLEKRFAKFQATSRKDFERAKSTRKLKESNKSTGSNHLNKPSNKANKPINSVTAPATSSDNPAQPTASDSKRTTSSSSKNIGIRSASKERIEQPQTDMSIKAVDGMQHVGKRALTTMVSHDSEVRLKE